jgi:hypothetical protein
MCVSSEGVRSDECVKFAEGQLALPTEATLGIR